MTTLLKLSLAGAPGTPGTPGTAPVPATLGTPATGPTPAWTETITIPAGPGIIYYVRIVDIHGRVYYSPVYGTVPAHIYTIYHPATAGSPGTPGTPAIPGTPGIPPTPPGPTDYQIGWNAGASSISSLAASGEYSFSVPGSSVGVVTGLNNVDAGTTYGEIDYAFSLDSGSYRVMENGVAKTSPAPYATADVLAVTRIGPLVRYYKGNTLVYTSTVPSYGAVFADSSLYMGGDQITGAALTSTVPPLHGADTGAVTGVLCAVAGGALSGTNAGYVVGTLTAVTGAAASYVLGSASAGQIRLTGTAYAAGFSAWCPGQLAALTGYSESGLLAPQFAVVAGYIGQLNGFSYTSTVNTGAATGVLASLGGGALSGTNQGRVVGLLTAVDGVAYDEALFNSQSIMDGTFPAATMMGFGHIGQVFDSEGNDVGYGMFGHAPAATLLAYGGGSMIGQLPFPVLTTSGTVTILGRMVGTGPGATITASGTVTVLGQMIGTWRGFSLTASGGGCMIATGPGATITASGLTGMVGRVYGVAPAATLFSTGTLYNFGRVTGILTGLSVANAGRMIAIAPAPQLFATGGFTVTVTYEGYSVTLIPSQDGVTTATTHYTNYPFDQILRWGDTYYGVAADGLYELGTDDYNGIPIVSEVTTALSDFGHPEFKRAVSLQLGGRVGADMNVSIVTAETDTNTYPYRPVDKRGARNHRVLFGKGVRARYWSYKFTNTAGEDFALDDMTPDVAVTRRNV